ncbi:molybdenum cofactor guanylyltransferase [Candidatus Gracilibacteria bacterium]|nr:molybdenum cofactor guanylyltransferase [Candidatus Gracilibacteria bacterium]
MSGSAPVEKDAALTGIVLAGGTSRRLGYDKRCLRFWGEEHSTLLEHTVQIINTLCAETIVVLNDAEMWPELPARIVPDYWPNSGPLGGIVSALRVMRHEYALVVAADMPFLNSTLLSALCGEPRNYDVLVPQQYDAQSGMLWPEPLHALYARRCCPSFVAQLVVGDAAVHRALNTVRTRYLPPSYCTHFDASGKTFWSINTVEDVDRIRRQLRADEH